MINLLLVCFAVLSYLIGSINWAVFISKSKKRDIRTLGSGNPGTLNMSRNFGLKFGLLTFFLDVLKGAIPTLVTYFIFMGAKFENSEFYISDFAIFLSGLCVVLGHIFPIYMGFRGGKGIASSIGVLIVCNSVYGWEWAVVVIMALVAALLFIYFTEFGAMGSFIAITPPAVSASIRLFLTYKGTTDYSTSVINVITNILILAICVFTWFAHRQNIKRMLAGEEHPTSIKSMIIKAKAKKLEKKRALEQTSSNNEKIETDTKE